MEYSTNFLTEREARTIPPPKEHTHVEHWHKGDTWFGVRVMRAKAKSHQVTRSWLVRWHEHGRDHRRVLGRIETVPWLAARKKALEIVEKVRARKATPGISKTFGQAYADYVKRKGDSWSPDTQVNYRKSSAYLLARWENKRIDLITEEDCTSLYHDIKGDVLRRVEESSVKIEGRNGSATAIAALRLAKAVFADLVRRGILMANPCQALIDDGVFDAREARSRMIHRKDLPKFWNWLHTHPSPAVRDYILMTLFMGLRQSVAGSLRWENLIESDGKYHYVMRSDQRGNKRKQEIPVPIPDYLVETVIKPRLTSPTKHPIWIIESPKKLDQPLHSVRGSYEHLATKTGVRVSDHDMRRTIATLTKFLCGEILAQRILTHSVQARDARHAVTSGYVITEVDDLREGMNKVIDYVRALAEEPADSVREQSNHAAFKHAAESQNLHEQP